MVCIECWIPVIGLLFHFLAQLWAKFSGKPAPVYVPPTCPITNKAAKDAGGDPLPADHPPVAGEPLKAPAPVGAAAAS